MNILITGGAGYLGSLLVPHILNNLKCNITILDKLSYGIAPILYIISDNNVRFVHADIRDKSIIKEEISKHDVIIHLASIVGFPACTKDPTSAITINQEATVNMCEYISANQIYIFASTGSSYGDVKGICDEETRINPLTLYGKTKAVAEKASREIGGIALRFATVYGISPRMRLDLLINDFVYQTIHNKNIILFEGHFRRTFIHVKDIVESILFAINNYKSMIGEAFNIGTEAGNFTKKEIAEILKTKIDYYLVEAAIGTDEDKRDYEVSYEKIKKLGFTCKIDLEEGIDELLKVLPYIKLINPWKNA